MRDQVRIARLIREAREGNEDSFRDLLEEHRDSITSTLIACGIRTAETAADLTQDTALRAWLRLDSLRDSTSFSPWIRQIAANAARDHLRRLTVRREESLESAAQLVSPEDPGRDTERRAEIQEMSGGPVGRGRCQSSPSWKSERLARRFARLRTAWAFPRMR